MWKLIVETNVKMNIFKCKDKNEVYEIIDKIRYLETVKLANVKGIIAYEIEK